MKTVILAGGFGTRLSEETTARPKPMVEVGSRPILWHIMKIYSHYGFNEFVIALGYKADMIKRYFLEYANLNGNMTINLLGDSHEVIRHEQDRWSVHLYDTGYNSNTGGRLKILKDVLYKEPFMVTYGDGVSNINIQEVLAFHKKHGKMVTLTAVHPTARFGGLAIDESGKVERFKEKPKAGEGWINGGFMVCEPQLLDLIPDTTSSLESDVLERLSEEGQLMAFLHDDFWQCMDTQRDMHYLEGLWSAGKAPWKVW